MSRNYTFTRHLCNYHSISILEHMGLSLWKPIIHWGSQFESELFRDLSAIIGFHRPSTTAYNPQTNGMIERIHCTLKTVIITRKPRWLNALPIILLGIRNMPNDQGFSPATAVIGSQLLLLKPIIDQEYPNLNKDGVKKSPRRYKS